MYQYNLLNVVVIDGDTVSCDIDLGFDIIQRNQRVRLFAINAPEKDTQAGINSKLYLDKLLSGQEIVLRSVKDKKEKFGRYLGVLYIGNVNINRELLKLGYATLFMAKMSDLDNLPLSV